VSLKATGLNPFRFAGIVTGEDFIDRESELREFITSALSGIHLLLESPRRLGKSSLVAEAFRRIGSKAVCAHVDVYGATSEAAFASSLLANLGEALPRLPAGEALSLVREHLPSLRPRVLMAERGKIAIDPVWPASADRAMEELLDFPEVVASVAGKQLVLALDEFQEVLQWGGVALMKRMRARFQRHRHVTYVFSGSRRHLLRGMFLDEEAAFYRFAQRIALGPIPQEALAEYVRERFSKRPGGIGAEVLGALLERTGGHPYATQRLCAKLWGLGRRPRGREDVDLAVRLIAAEDSPLFERLWEEVAGASQRHLLRAVAQEGRAQYGAEFIARYFLKSAAHVQKAVRSLEERGFLEEGRIPDLYFSEWIRQRIR